MPSLKSFTLSNLIRKCWILIDRYHGLDFISVIQPEEVGLDPNYAHLSSSSGNRYLANVLSDLSITKKDLIIDIGCGKGSAMRTMLKFPFARVDGLELSEHIAAIAARNFGRLKINRSDIFVGDASTFTDYDAYNFVYFYNPFPCVVMLTVIDNIIQSIRRFRREVILIYKNPVCNDVIVHQGGFYKIREYPCEWGNWIYIYSSFDIQHSRINR
ncbi:MAG: class I SAM-dependent methyltransferase [Lentisphaerae bacterium]|nr:class I SAM-dependent methyltransferase [Lentisphaerota bacterium]